MNFLTALSGQSIVLGYGSWVPGEPPAHHCLGGQERADRPTELPVGVLGGWVWRQAKEWGRAGLRPRRALLDEGRGPELAVTSRSGW